MPVFVYVYTEFCLALVLSVFYALIAHSSNEKVKCSSSSVASVAASEPHCSCFLLWKLSRTLLQHFYGLNYNLCYMSQNCRYHWMTGMSSAKKITAIILDCTLEETNNANLSLCKSTLTLESFLN